MADIGAAVGLRGPSLYKHVPSKQHLLAEITVDTMDALLAAHSVAVRGTDDPAGRLRRATEAHVRDHARHRLEAFVGNRELRGLDEDNRAAVLGKRARYERAFRALVDEGVLAGWFRVTSARLVTCAVLDLGMGVSAWYREDGELTEDEIAWHYADLALHIVGAIS